MLLYFYLRQPAQRLRLQKSEDSTSNAPANPHPILQVIFFENLIFDLIDFAEKQKVFSLSEKTTAAHDSISKIFANQFFKVKFHHVLLFLF